MYAEERLKAEIVQETLQKSGEATDTQIYTVLVYTPPMQ